MSFVKNDIKEVLDEYVLLKKSVSETTSAVDVSMFGESNGLADVTLVVEGRRIPVTKAVLAFSSPVFLAMFQSDFKEKEKSEIPLPDKKLPAFVMFLRCLYPNIMEKVTAESVYDVIYLANEYQTEHLRIACEQVMVKELFKWEDPTSPGCCLEVYRHLAIAETCQLDELRARCIGIAAEATQKDRESAATVYPISEKMERIVEKQTIKKHEINTADLKDLLNGFGGKKARQQREVVVLVGMKRCQHSNIPYNDIYHYPDYYYYYYNNYYYNYSYYYSYYYYYNYYDNATTYNYNFNEKH
ncbi:BAT38-like protein [Mya arenaria]|uniref:BAT38-like protein n=1 Tax=Mya arenaria TaxID=6604 RepID=A0ABY7GA26_MYAAR|nr:BAT38-like protein [Mya arenaria]